MNRRNVRKAQLRKAHAQHALRIGEFVPAVALVGFGETIQLDENPNYSNDRIGAQQLQVAGRWYQTD